MAISCKNIRRFHRVLDFPLGEPALWVKRPSGRTLFGHKIWHLMEGALKNGGYTQVTVWNLMEWTHDLVEILCGLRSRGRRC